MHVETGAQPGVADVAVGEGLVLRYGCALAALPPELVARFAPLDFDADTERFVNSALAAPHGALASRSFALLRRMLSDYDAYGLLGMYPMHVCSAAQFRALLGDAPRADRRLLDVGAGDGGVTACIAPGFERVVVTESSRVLRARLRRRGFEVWPHDLAHVPLPEALRADVVTCLNVLDRTSHPRSLLAALRAALRPGGRLLLSVPLPLRPHVQRAGHTIDPEELLPLCEGGWEHGVSQLVRQLIEPAGFPVLRIARAPYLSRGDSHCPLYVLDAALFVCGEPLAPIKNE